MNIRKRRHHEVSVNLTPLIDVVFLLLIFFMLSTTFKKQSALAIELPDVGPGHSQPDHHAELSINANGEYGLNGEKLSTNQQALRQRLATLNRSEPLIIVGDKQAPYQAVVSAMDQAGQLGITHIKILAKESS